MNKFSILRIAHLIYLGLLLCFIVFYFVDYRPYKIETACAEKSAKQVLGANSDQDANGLYKKLYKECVTR